MTNLAPSTPFALAVLMATALWPAPGRADIYKCVDGAAIAYQSMPCAPGAQQTQMAKDAPRGAVPLDDAQPIQVADARPRPSKSAASRMTRKPGPWTHTTLTIGMSDDELLNMPAWGRPARIVRTRMPRGWSEEWFYPTATGGERRLLFVNGKLADIGESPVGDTTLYLASAPTIRMQ